MTSASQISTGGTASRVWAALVVLALVSLCSAPVLAQDGGALEEVHAAPDGSQTSPAAAEGQPLRVHLGAVPVIIHAVDLKAGTATTTFYLWTRWRGAFDHTRVEVANGTLEARDYDEHYTTEGVHYAYARCRATTRVWVDYHAYPFDRHELQLALEHIALDETLLHFVIDTPSLRNIQSPGLAGWIVERPRYDVVRHAYRTNWGAPYVSLSDPATYEQFRVRVTLRHAPLAAFAKTFLSLLISVLITALVFWIDPTDTGARIGLGVAGIFGAVTSQVLAASNIPDLGYMTLSDKEHIAGMVFIFFALAESVLVARLARAGAVERAQRIDRRAMVGSYAVFTTTFVGLLTAAR
jgi:hypothetical protein